MTDDREAFEFLERLDLDVEDYLTRDTLTEAIKQRFKDAELGTPSRRQIDLIQNIGETTLFDFTSSGVRRVDFLRLGQPQTRFVLTGRRGLYGLTKAIQFIKGLLE